jgi:hypothetical protein
MVSTLLYYGGIAPPGERYLINEGGEPARLLRIS